MKIEKHYVPKYLFAQPQIGWWELDEFLFVIVGTGIGIIIGGYGTIIGGFIGIILAKLYGMTKETKQPGFLKHWAYSLGIYKWTPEYWIKKLVP